MKRKIVLFVVFCLLCCLCVAPFSVSAAEEDKEVIEIESILNTSSFPVQSNTVWNGSICTITNTTGTVFYFNIARFSVVAGRSYTFYISSFQAPPSGEQNYFLVSDSNFNTLSDINIDGLSVKSYDYTGLCYLRIGSSIQGSQSFSVGVFEADVNDEELQQSIYYAIGKIDGAKENYEQGYNDGLNNGLNNVSTSLGIFKYATFSYGLTYSTSDDYTSVTFVSLPDNGKKGYYNGFYVPVAIFDDNDFLVGSDIDAKGGILKLDFGVNGIDISKYSVFNVNNYSPGLISNTTPYGVSVGFIFTDNTSFYVNSANGLFSSIDIRDYKSSGSFFLKTLLIECAQIDIVPIGLSTDSVYYNAYENGYGIGFNEGSQVGYTDGYQNGKNAGYSQGYNAGAADAGNYTFLGLLGAIVDAPIQAITGLLNFDLLGFNMAGFFYALVTLAITITVVRLFI